MKTVVSFGAGVNSSALLVGLMEKNIAVDAILFSDTGGEKPETYDHLERMGNWLVGNGMTKITVVREANTLEDDCLSRETLPSKAFGFGSCSEHFKIRPQRRWLKEKGWKDVVWLVGIHAGEQRRAWRTLNQRTDVQFPLIEWNWDQSDCVEALKRHGIPVPIKSACFFCPATPKREVLQLAESHPELIERAIEMEDNALENLDVIKGLGRHWSWRALVNADRQQLKLFDDLQSPICETCVDW